MQPIYNIGILAHVDAGKTTITENLLHLGGATRTLGSVDKGSAVTDSMSIEQQRGISVRAATVSFSWKSCQINLIDTPGHADFSAEVERVLSVLDGAIMVVSAVESVQAHTFALWEALRELQVPTLIFVNKIDRAGADFENVLHDLDQDLRCFPVPILFPENEGSNEAAISQAWSNQNYFGQFFPDLMASSLENLADFDDGIMEKYLEDQELSEKEIFNALIQHTSLKKLLPYFVEWQKTALGWKNY